MNADRIVKSPHIQTEQFRRRAALGCLGVFLSLAFLAGWYYKLQVHDHAMYSTRSDSNRIRLRPLVPARGMIYDRNGRVLAENIPAFRLDVTPNKVAHMRVMLSELGKIIPLSEEELDHFNRECRARPNFLPVTLKLKLTEEQMAHFAVDRWRFPGVELEPYLTRHYPFGDLFAHVIGYVGRMDEKDYKRLGRAQSVVGQIGKSGIERYYETLLRGKIGYEQVETNVQGRVVRILGSVPAQSGADLHLSIDVDLQRSIVAAFGKYEGAAIAVDPNNGEILAMVSLPTYNPNLFVNGISQADFQILNTNPSRPQFNRLISGGVAPGSTIKPLIALAGLDSGVRQPQDKILSTGMFYLPGIRRGWGDAVRTGHGWTDLRKSIAQSVNTYYYQLALDLGIERFDTYMTHYGMGQKTGIDLSGEIKGILPSPAYKLKVRKEHWYTGDTVNIAIGQGDWKVTPVQLVRAIAGIANGSLRCPHIATAQRDGYDGKWQRLVEPPAIAMSPSQAHLKIIRDAMMDVMRPGGSGYGAAIGAPYAIAGKTGTAQVASRHGTEAVNPLSLPIYLRHRALFVGFAPALHPVIALAVAVEGGGYGASTAAPIARKIFDSWLLGKLPEGVEPLDTENRTTALGVTMIDTLPSVLPLSTEQAEKIARDTDPIMIGGSVFSPSLPLPTKDER